MWKRLLPMLLLGFLAGCWPFESPTEPSRCDEPNSLNRGAREPCRFSKVVFYAGTTAPAGVLPVAVTIDGATAGSITGVYPGSAPGNCSADFTGKYNLSDGNRHDWNARSANNLAWSGTVQASATLDCIAIRVF